MFKNISRISLISLGLASVIFLTGCATTVKPYNQVPTTKTWISNGKYLKTHFDGLHAKLAASIVDATTRMSPTVSAGVTSDKLNTLATAVTSAEQAFPKTLPYETVSYDPKTFRTGYIAPALVPTDEKALARELGVTSRATQKYINAVNVAVTAWETELAAEKAAIAAQQAAAAEAAKAKASHSHSSAQVARPAGSNSESYDYSKSPGMSLQARIEWLASTLPITIESLTVKSGCPGSGVDADACTAGAANGYVGYTSVDPRAAGYTNCYLREILAHEGRHQTQFRNSQITFDDNGQISNRSWAEADANSFMRHFACGSGN